MRKHLFFFFLMFSSLIVSGQITTPKHIIKWSSIAQINFPDKKSIPVLNFQNATHNSEEGFLPRIEIPIIKSNLHQKFSATIINAVYIDVNSAEAEILKKSKLINNNIAIKCNVITIKKQHKNTVTFLPFRYNQNKARYEKLKEFQLNIIGSKATNAKLRNDQTYASSSILKNGYWYKIAIVKDGVYKLSYTFLEELGIDLKSVAPKNIRIYGNGGGMLPELNTAPHYDDLTENAIFIKGESDNSFDEEDYILFYGKGQVKWTYDPNTCPVFTHQINLYTDTSYYFISIDLGQGKRIPNTSSSSLTANISVTSFDDFAHHQNESINFITSGKHWFGKTINNGSSLSIPFSFPNITSSTASINTKIASRSFSSEGNYTIQCQSGSTTMEIAKTIDDHYSGNYAEMGTECFSFSPTSSETTVNIYNSSNEAEAWLDYIEINVRRNLIVKDVQLTFRDIISVGNENIAQYNLTSDSTIQVWNLSDVFNIKSQTLNKSKNNYNFKASANSLIEYVAFSDYSLLSPIAIGQIANQNLHALSNIDYIIVTHKTFVNEAKQLASYHETADGLSSIVVTTEQVYNEFSSGAKDISAIRNFLKMLYDKATSTDQQPKYLLLFGDGTYDPKNRVRINNDLIPTYQSENSVKIVSSYVSDDFYGLLDDGEGLWNGDAVDIGIGRIPVKTSFEAQLIINKIFNYSKTGLLSTGSSSKSNSPYGKWRNVICFIADDGDNNTHISQANQQATFIDTTYKNYNIDKIYLDAHIQESRPGGHRYPTVKTALNNRVQKGALIINYTGHGAEGGLAHEVILNREMVEEWDNTHKLFLFITASCEVSRYDNPEYTSAGERILLHDKAGAIALFSTVRVVYASPNFQLNQNFYKAAFEPINGKMPRLGDLYLNIKTQPGGNILNSRNFALLGDPAVTLAYPKHIIKTDSINKTGLNNTSIDTLQALSLITISGHIENENGIQLNDYNGIIYPTVFDKASEITTFSNKGVNESPPFNFNLQKHILFNGKATVTNGKFSFSFIIPKDISYKYGIGKISYYAENGTEDASGYYDKIIIGGFNKNAVADEIAPEVGLFLNDNKFVFGGLTSENPDLYSELFDENGINIVGYTVGHDITAILDNDVLNPIILNDYYTADLNTFKSGTIRFPFKNLSDGNHTLKISAWDIYNNNTESYTEFVVAKTSKVALSHVLNYPNPFTTRTLFYFEHNQANTQMEVQIQIFTITGKIVKTIDQFITTEGYRSEPIEWDGKDDFGDKIGRGVYIYRIKAKTDDFGTAEVFEKLVILN